VMEEGWKFGSPPKEAAMGEVAAMETARSIVRHCTQGGQGVESIASLVMRVKKQQRGSRQWRVKPKSIGP